MERLCEKLILLAVGVSAFAAAADAATLDEQLTERIKANRAYTETYVELHEETQASAETVLTTRAVGEAWVQLYDYARDSEDESLKRQLLRLEYLFEISKHHYDLDAAESEAEKKVLQNGLEKYESLLQKLDETNPKVLPAP